MPGKLGTQMVTMAIFVQYHHNGVHTLITMTMHGYPSGSLINVLDLYIYNTKVKLE